MDGGESITGMRLGEVIRKWRIMSEITLRVAGKQMGISPATLLRIEQGKDCDSMTLSRVLCWLMAKTDA